MIARIMLPSSSLIKVRFEQMRLQRFLERSQSSSRADSHRQSVPETGSSDSKCLFPDSFLGHWLVQNQCIHLAQSTVSLSGHHKLAEIGGSHAVDALEHRHQDLVGHTMDDRQPV